MSIGPFVTVDWLAGAARGARHRRGRRLLGNLPAMGRDAEADFRAAHIPGANRFDIDAVRDEASALPHMLPSPEAFASRCARWASRRHDVVVYDGMGLFSAPRLRWTLKAFGAREVAGAGGRPVRAWVAVGTRSTSRARRPRDTGATSPCPARPLRRSPMSATCSGRWPLGPGGRARSGRPLLAGEEAEPRPRRAAGPHAGCPQPALTRPCRRPAGSRRGRVAPSGRPGRHRPRPPGGRHLRLGRDRGDRRHRPRGASAARPARSTTARGRNGGAARETCRSRPGGDRVAGAGPRGIRRPGTVRRLGSPAAVPAAASGAAARAGARSADRA